MAPMSCDQREQDAAALILLQMADPNWDSPGSEELEQEKEIEDEEAEQKAQDVALETVVKPKALAFNTPAFVAGSTSASQSSSAPSTPSSTSSFSVKGASFAEIDAHQQTIQQIRAALTPKQRSALNLKEYSHYDLAGNKIGTLWQTRAEQRTFRQAQRRRGAKTVRAGTTNGMKLNRRC
ncbi:unnamed protein product [Aureobasidium vineae]|uniref:Uncharacterized protein n=1 Tax=Aureobasidium vineae TaxID=2773715 RepID=A0A9N8P4N4_9PEZI|nr:unnamed protein product [Aureobasidium vineae]